MSVRSEKPATNAMMPVMDFQAAAGDAGAELDPNAFAVAAPENPLKRTVVVSIKASLNDLCLQKAKGTWAPSQEALRSIFQQRKHCSRANNALFSHALTTRSSNATPSPLGSHLSKAPLSPWAISRAWSSTT